METPMTGIVALLGQFMLASYQVSKGGVERTERDLYVLSEEHVRNGLPQRAFGPDTFLAGPPHIGDKAILAWIGRRQPLATDHFRTLLKLDMAGPGRIAKGGTPFERLYRDLCSTTLSRLIELKRRLEHMRREIEKPLNSPHLYQTSPAELVRSLRKTRRELDGTVDALRPLGLHRHPHIADFLAHKDDPSWG